MDTHRPIGIGALLSRDSLRSRDFGRQACSNGRRTFRFKHILHSIRDVGCVVQIYSSHTEASILRAEDMPLLLERNDMLCLNKEGKVQSKTKNRKNIGSQFLPPTPYKRTYRFDPRYGSSCIIKEIQMGGSHDRILVRAYLS
jgi:hypothetical protein